ncbi:MAG: CDGSH iron-sulfur domain-containing protein [Draconibacterium sp.]|nr:CDGSH iron-sulfur domain-containing protein [Draconibacterium sp.]
MESPIIFAKNPVAVNLEPGVYFWCACGKSKNQPFCDGSHRDTGIFPVQFKIDVKKEVYLCQCKQSKNKPFCDGTHRNL